MREKLLSEAELCGMELFREEVLSSGLSTQRCDRMKAQEAYNALLVNLGFDTVSRFVWVDSPWQMHGQLEDQLRDQLRDQLGDQLESQLRDQLGDQLRSQLDQAELQYWRWIEYVASLDGITVNQDRLRTLTLLGELGKETFWILPLKNGAIFCDRPIHIHRNEDNRLHCDQESAVGFADGWGIYAIHGVRFEKDTWQKIVDQDFTVKDLAELPTAEHRASAISMLRADRMLEALNAKLVSTGTKYRKLGFENKQESELYQVDDFMGLSGNTEYCLKMKHPSLDQEYIEWVHPDVGVKHDADLAQATAFGWTKEQYLGANEA